MSRRQNDWHISIWSIISVGSFVSLARSLSIFFNHRWRHSRQCYRAAASTFQIGTKIRVWHKLFAPAIAMEWHLTEDLRYNWTRAVWWNISFCLCIMQSYFYLYSSGKLLLLNFAEDEILWATVSRTWI